MKVEIQLGERGVKRVRRSIPPPHLPKLAGAQNATHLVNCTADHENCTTAAPELADGQLTLNLNLN